MVQLSSLLEDVSLFLRLDDDDVVEFEFVASNSAISIASGETSSVLPSLFDIVPRALA